MREDEFITRSERVVAYALDSESCRVDSNLGFQTLSDRTPPNGYDESDAVADVHALADAAPVYKRGVRNYVVGHVNVLYPLSVAAVAESGRLRMTARKRMYPDQASHALASADRERFEGDRNGYGRADSDNFPYGPFRESTADHVVTRLQYDLDQPDSPVDYAGAACAAKWITGTTMAMTEHALPSIVDVIEQSPSGSVLRHGSVLSAVDILNDDRGYPPRYNYVDPLLTATEDNHRQIKAHAVGSLCELAALVQPNEYGRGQPDPDAYRRIVDTLLDHLLVDQRAVQRRVLRWLGSVRWDGIEDTDATAVPDDARERTENGIQHCLERTDPIVRDRAEKVDLRR
jgi:hypothetical protein